METITKLFFVSFQLKLDKYICFSSDGVLYITFNVILIRKR